MNIHDEHGHTLAGKALLAIGTAAAGFTMADIDLALSIFLKFVSIASFVCYLLINQDKIKHGWHKFKSKWTR